MKLLLIDGSNLIFRAYYATENMNIINPDGIKVNAINTLISMLNKLVNEEKPTHMFIALDTGKSTFRHDMYADYKGKRSETPTDLKNQFPLAKDLYESMGIKFGYTDDFEADDLIATYATIAKKENFEVLVFSGDKDLLQLVDEKINVLTPKLGFAKAVYYDLDTFFEKYTFYPDRFIEYKALVGDTSDNIIGVPGIGDKTAKKLINEYPNFEAILDEAKNGNQTKKIWKNLANSIDQLKENLILVDLVCNVQPEFKIEDFAFNGFTLDKFLPFLQSQGFEKLYKDYSKNYTPNSTPVKENVKYNMFYDLDFTILNPLKDTYIIPIYEKENYISNPFTRFIIKNDNNYFIISNLKDIKELMLSNFCKITYNLKNILGILEIYEYNNVKSDIYLAASLIDNTNFKKNIVEILFDKQFEIDLNSINNLLLDRDVETNVSNILNNIENLFIILQNDIEEKELNNVLYNIELPLSPVLANMEVNGVFVNESEITRVTEIYQNQLESLQLKLENYTSINFNSTQQLSDYLFNTLELPSKGIKKNKNAFSTDVVNLEKLLHNISEIPEFDSSAQFINTLLKYRKLKKIHSTYLEGLKKHIKDGKVHPIINQLLTDTGRLSIIEPNIQNMPIRTDEGKIIRSFFDSGDFKYVVAIDYSQVELRVIAHLANESHMISDFRDNLDIHAETAKKIFNLDVVSNDERSKAKAINFGIIYGMSKYGLAQQVGISVEEADHFIEKYLETYPNIREFMRSQILKAKEFGFVDTSFGRKRYLPNINSNKYNDVENAKRIAINTPVQGTAADIMKITMVNIFDFIKDNKDIRLAMQIHDELVFYCNDLSILPKLKEIFETAVDYEVKLIADVSSGENWLECK